MNPATLAMSVRYKNAEKHNSNSLSQLFKWFLMLSARLANYRAVYLYLCRHIVREAKVQKYVYLPYRGAI